MPGILYIVATPIGNLGDIAPRVRETLAQSDVVLAEDTRVTIKLLNHLGLKKRMISCHDFNEKARSKIIEECANQTIALVSDAGTPLVSDPGLLIVRKAIECQMQIIPIPGPSAFLLALVASGLPCERFTFEGFLPNKAKLLNERLQELENERRTIVIYESPHRLLKTLNSICLVLGERKICLARELTKFHEEIVRGKISDIIGMVESKDAKILGEYVLVIEGAQNDTDSVSAEELSSQVVKMLAAGESVKSIVQKLTKTYKIKRSEIYRLALKESNRK